MILSNEKNAACKCCFDAAKSYSTERKALGQHSKNVNLPKAFWLTNSRTVPLNYHSSAEYPMSLGFQISQFESQVCFFAS